MFVEIIYHEDVEPFVHRTDFPLSVTIKREGEVVERRPCFMHPVFSSAISQLYDATIKIAKEGYDEKALEQLHLCEKHGYTDGDRCLYCYNPGLLGRRETLLQVWELMSEYADHGPVWKLRDWIRRNFEE